MDITTAGYADLKVLRDQIDQRLRELEQQTLADIEAKARAFGFALTATVEATPKIKRHRRTKAELAAANAIIPSVLSKESAHGSNGSVKGEADRGAE